MQVQPEISLLHFRNDIQYCYICEANQQGYIMPADDYIHAYKDKQLFYLYNMLMKWLTSGKKFLIYSLDVIFFFADSYHYRLFAWRQNANTFDWGRQITWQEITDSRF